MSAALPHVYRAMEDTDFKFSDKIKSFLLYGGSCDLLQSFKVDKFEKDCPKNTHVLENGQNKQLSNIKAMSQSLIREWESQKNESTAFNTSLKSVLDDVRERSEQLYIEDLDDKLRQYKLLQMKIQHLSLCCAIKRLRGFTDVFHIPSLVFEVMNEAPSVLLKQSRLKAMVLQSVSEMKLILLNKFHTIFEEHLSDNEHDRSATTKQSTQLWTTFLSAARDWLLAYTLVSMLPVVLTSSQTAIGEKYQDSLDEALTPIWGRFYFHLEIAREAKSLSQTMWSFQYAKSFIRMLLDLSNQITSTGQLQRLYAGLSYEDLGVNMVIEKAAKFLRAHLAQIIVEFHPFSSSVCIQFVEETLALEESIYAPLITDYASRAMLDGAMSVGISSVVYDSKEVFHQWVSIEHSFFVDSLQKVFDQRISKIYALSFGRSIGSGELQDTGNPVI